MGYLDHRAHQVWRRQSDKGNQAGLGDRCAASQRKGHHQRDPKRRQRQPQAPGGGLAQAQAIKHPAQRDRNAEANQPDRTHQPKRRPANERRATQHERLHGLQDLSHLQILLLTLVQY